MKTIAPLVGRRFMLDPTKARRVLGFAPRPAAETLRDCAESLLAFTG